MTFIPSPSPLSHPRPCLTLRCLGLHLSATGSQFLSALTMDTVRALTAEAAVGYLKQVRGGSQIVTVPSSFSSAFITSSLSSSLPLLPPPLLPPRYSPSHFTHRSPSPAGRRASSAQSAESGVRGPDGPLPAHPHGQVTTHPINTPY